ncbi:MAG: hypothetical protein HFE39_09690, partial [Clostridiales bacterium]|nr:hypothetical protein [Clostridiales bacterium]
MQIPINHKLIGVKIQAQQGDNNATSIIFAIPNPRSPDLSLCRFYAITDQSGTLDKIALETTVENDVIKTSWTLGLPLTAKAGLVRYQLVAEDLDHNVVWHTGQADIEIAESIDADGYIMAHYPTLLQQWEKRMQDLEKKAASVLEETQGHSEQARGYVAQACESAEQAADGARAAKDALQQTQAIQTEVTHGVQAAADAQKAAEEAAGQAQTHRAAAEQCAQNTAADRAAV